MWPIYLIFLIIILAVIFILTAPQFGKKPHGAHLALIKKSPQYKSDTFDNSPKSDPNFGLRRSLPFALKMLLEKPKNRRPKNSLPSLQPEFNKDIGAHLTWFGHSTFLYEINGRKILFDPMLGKYSSPVPGFFKRYAYALPAEAANLPHLDAVIISHDHYDHLDYGTIKILKNKVDRFICPLGVGSHLLRWGISKEKIIELDWWQDFKFQDLTITATPSQHFSGRSIGTAKTTLWAGFAIKNKDANVFFGGDSGYFNGFKIIGEKLGPFDLTLLDSGQYSEYWQEVHMFPEQSVIAHKELKGKVFMPIHWSAFTLSTHEWLDPAERAVKAALKENIDMVTPKIGERFNIITDRPKELWWQGLN